MRFASVHPFVGATKRARLGFDPLHQPESRAGLSPPGAPADRTVRTNPGQGFVE